MMESEEATQAPQDPLPPPPPATKDEPPKKMISLKHIKSTEPSQPANNNSERRRVFLPEADSKQDFPISVTLHLSTEQLNEALKHEWKYEGLNSPTRMRDAGLLLILLQ